jgi:hypothetical protein
MQTSIQMIIEEVKRLSNLYENRVPSVLLLDYLFKEQQKQLITEIMEEDAKDGLYEDEVDKLAHQYNPVMKLDAEFIRAGFKAGYKKAKEIQKEQSQPEISDEEIEKAANEHNRKGYFISPSSFTAT